MASSEGKGTRSRGGKIGREWRTKKNGLRTRGRIDLRRGESSAYERLHDCNQRGDALLGIIGQDFVVREGSPEGETAQS